MFCPNCGTQIQDGSKFCASCGKPVGQAGCPSCGAELKAGANFCPNCGAGAGGGGRANPVPMPTPFPVANPPGIATDLKGLLPGEVVLMDTGLFPISYIKNLMTSINGKLYLTNQRLVFKAGALQGVGGVSSGGLFIPNPKDAGKAKTFFGIPLNEISGVESGWSHVTVQAGEKYKFGGMTKTKEWAAALNRARGIG